MANDISLAVGDGSRRMTYAELADVRGISVTSAERLVRRRRWGRQVGNDGVVRVLVPLTEARKPRKTKAPDKDLSALGQSRMSPQISSQTSGADIREDSDAAIRPLASAVEALREQLTIANDRAEAAERRCGELRAELVAEHRRIISILTERAPWWRRWFR